MRTTLDIDDDVLLAVKDAAARAKLPIGRMMSEIVRQALVPKQPARERNGVLVFDSRSDAPLLTLDAVNRLRDEE